MDPDPRFDALARDVLLSAAVTFAVLGLAGIGAWHVLGWIVGWW